MLRQNEIKILSQFLKKIKMVSFGSSIMKNVAAPSGRSVFPVKLTFCIAVELLLLFIYLNLSLSFYSVYRNNHNRANNQLYNNLLDILKFFECYHMFSFYFLPD